MRRCRVDDDRRGRSEVGPGGIDDGVVDVDHRVYALQALVDDLYGMWSLFQPGRCEHCFDQLAFVRGRRTGGDVQGMSPISVWNAAWYRRSLVTNAPSRYTE